MIRALIAVAAAIAHAQPGPPPGVNLLIADRDNNRVLIVSPRKRICG